MRSPYSPSLFIRWVPVLVALSSPVFAEVEIPPAHHPWGRFGAGSWTRIRMTTEGTTDGKTVSTASEITTTLVKVEPDGVTLTRDEKNGDKVKRGKPIKYFWDGTPVDDPNDAEQAGSQSKRATIKYGLGEVDVDGKTHACQTHERTERDLFGASVVKSWYCPDQSPYFLKRVTRTTNKFPELRAMRVTRLAVTKTVLDKELVCWESDTVFNGQQIKSRTTSYHSMDVPGGLVLSEETRNDPQQGISGTIRWEVVAYQAKGPEGGNE